MNPDKRKTLKTLAAGSAMAAIPSLSLTKPASPLNVVVEHGLSRDHDRVVISNSGTDSVNISHITPKVIHTPDGSIEMDILAAEGPLMLPPGSQLVFPIKTTAPSRRGQMQTPFVPELVAHKLKIHVPGVNVTNSTVLTRFNPELV
ncbi:MAG: hypothetical protein AAF402_01750 [Pseudomonadota bacterium]